MNLRTTEHGDSAATATLSQALPPLREGGANPAGCDSPAGLSSPVMTDDELRIVALTHRDLKTRSQALDVLLLRATTSAIRAGYCDQKHDNRVSA